MENKDKLTTQEKEMIFNNVWDQYIEEDRSIFLKVWQPIVLAAIILFSVFTIYLFSNSSGGVKNNFSSKKDEVKKVKIVDNEMLLSYDTDWDNWDVEISVDDLEEIVQSI